MEVIPLPFSQAFVIQEGNIYSQLFEKEFIKSLFFIS